MMSKQEQFITLAKTAHGDKYDYSLVNYISPRTKTSIVCHDHGVFLQTPHSHATTRQGCSKCAALFRGKKSALTVQKFIEQAKFLHGDRYDYSKVEYKNNHTNVIINCLVHGDFHQIPGSHLNGRGCPKCGGKLKLTTSEFITKAKEVHGDLYNYSESNYVTAKVPLKIGCEKHGPFYQIPNNHTQGQGCPSCMVRVIVNTVEFVERAKVTHGDLYDYSKAEYVDGKTKVTIGCKKHGDFEQSASEHIRGRGCQICKSSKGELAIRKILLKHNIEFIQEYSIPGQEYKFKYDFYIPSHNLFIEYHGQQHYFPVDYFGGEEVFKTQQLRDSLKRCLAKECKYKLLEIKYTTLLSLTEEEFEKKLLFNLNRFKLVKGGV